MKMSLKYLAKQLVKPAKPTWNGTLELSIWDQIGSINHFSTVYFYRPSQDWLTPNDKIFNTLRDTLSEVLVWFYPLAGRLRWMDGGRLELDCNSMGVQLMEAEADAKIDDFGDFSCLEEYDHYLVPNVDYNVPISEIPLFIVQVTRFKCEGIGLSLTMSHAVMDGPSVIHFLTEWVKIAQGEPIGLEPHFDRNFMREIMSLGKPPKMEHLEYEDAPSLLEQFNNMDLKKKKTTIAMLKLEKSQVDNLKSMANEGKLIDENARPYTRYEAVAGYVWRCACKARKHKYDQPTRLGFCVDFRSRLQPPLRPGYFGNAIIDVVATGVSGALMSRPLGYASGRIREASMKVTDKYVRSAIEFMKNQHDLTRFQNLHALGNNLKDHPLYGDPNIHVVSWINLTLYGLDLGWGKEMYMGPGNYDFDGDSVILPGPKADGSLVVALCLQEAHMDDFKKFFYEDIMA